MAITGGFDEEESTAGYAIGNGLRIVLILLPYVPWTSILEKFLSPL